MSIITIIDTGISKIYEEKYLRGRVLGKYIYNELSNGVEKADNLDDEVGHGTMVCSAVNTIYKDVKFNFIKAFGNNYETNEGILINILNDINTMNIKTDVIHLSFGVQMVERLAELELILNKLRDKGIIIVAAFSNEQVISYPAACKSVIGVAFDTSIISVNDWIYVENSPINIYATGQIKNFINCNGKSVRSAGASFAAAYISGHISKQMDLQGIEFEIESYLKQNAKRIYVAPAIVNNACFNINKIVIFPFNKENHSIVRNSRMLDVELCAVLDTKYSSYIGKNVFDTLSISDYELYDEDAEKEVCVVQDIMKFNWETDFDTFVLGHVEELEAIFPFSIYEYICRMCKKYHKKLYSYGSFLNANEAINAREWIYSPKIQFENIYENHCGMLYEIAKPVVGVFGTSSKQGKWSLQLKLREIFEERGYKTGHLGTEPNALLFRNTAMTSIGFKTALNMSQSEAISLFNYQLHTIEPESDIIFFGTQSNVIPISFGGLPTVPVYTYEMICGCEPQASILCINEWDDIEYIKKCVKYLESFYDNKVIALAYFFKDNYVKWDASGASINELKYNYEQIALIKEQMELPIYNMEHKNEMELLCDDLINYF